MCRVLHQRVVAAFHVSVTPAAIEAGRVARADMDDVAPGGILSPGRCTQRMAPVPASAGKAFACLTGHEPFPEARRCSRERFHLMPNSSLRLQCTPPHYLGRRPLGGAPVRGRLPGPVRRGAGVLRRWLPDPELPARAGDPPRASPRRSGRASGLPPPRTPPRGGAGRPESRPRAGPASGRRSERNVPVARPRVPRAPPAPGSCRGLR